MPYALGPRLARPTGSTVSSASGRLGRKVGMVEMIRLADEPWAPVAQGHPGAEVVRSVRVALRGTNDRDNRVAAIDLPLSKTATPRFRFIAWFAVLFTQHSTFVPGSLQFGSDAGTRAECEIGRNPSLVRT